MLGNQYQVNSEEPSFLPSFLATRNVSNKNGGISVSKKRARISRIYAVFAQNNVFSRFKNIQKNYMVFPARAWISLLLIMHQFSRRLRVFSKRVAAFSASEELG